MVISLLVVLRSKTRMLGGCMLMLGVSVGLGLPVTAQQVPPDDQSAFEPHGLSYKQVTRKIFEREHKTLAELQGLQLVTETYIQSLQNRQHDGLDTTTDINAEGATDDAYFLGQVNLIHLEDDQPIENLLYGKDWEDRYIKIRGGLYDKLVPLGNLMMFFVDLFSFDADTYTLTYSGEENVGGVQCMRFSVTPNDHRASGRFSGTIWVEPSAFQIIRIEGKFIGPFGYRKLRNDRYFHFDSWRERTEDGRWMPTFTCFDERRTFREDGNLDFHYRGLSFLWPARTRSQQLAIGNSAIDKGADEPEGIEERDLVARLQNDGLLAAPGTVEKKLDGIVDEITNAAGIGKSIHCRVLLTTPLEAMAMGHTIIVSRGLLNVVPDDAVLALVLARQIARVELDFLGHPSQDLRRSIFDSPDKHDFGGFGIRDDVETRRAADSRARFLLSGTRYASATSQSDAFLARLYGQSHRFKNLVRPRFGRPIVQEETSGKVPGYVGRLHLDDNYTLSWDGTIKQKSITNATTDDLRAKQLLGRPPVGQ